MIVNDDNTNVNIADHSTNDNTADNNDKLQHNDPQFHRNYIFPQILSDFDFEYGKSKSKISSQLNLKDTISQPSGTIIPLADLENGQTKNIASANSKLNYQKSILRPASFAMQYYLLLQRNLLCARRNYVSNFFFLH